MNGDLLENCEWKKSKYEMWTKRNKKLIFEK